MVKVPSGTEKRYTNMRMRVKELAVDGLDFYAEYDTGTKWFVDSVNGAAGNTGRAPGSAVASLATLLDSGSLAADDRIYLLPGHEETVSAAAGLDVDTAGITIYFLGHGDNRAKIIFDTAAGADMDIDAANIVLVRPLFEAGVDALTGPIDVNAADFTIIDGEWRDAPGLAAIDCIVADANADRMTIDGWRFIASTTGTQKQSNIQVAGAEDVIIRRANIVGDFGTGNIENGTAWIDVLLEDVVLENKAAGPVVGILLQGTSTGTARNVHIRVASGTTYVTADNDMQWFESFGTGIDATAGEKIGTQLAGDIEAKVDVVDTNVDSILAATTADGTLSTTVQMPFGRRVTKVGDVSTSTDALFNVTGKCLITLMVGEVTSVIATTTSLQLVTSTNSIIICASTDIITDVAGTLYMVTGDYDDVLNGAQVPNADIAMTKTGTTAPFMVNDDAIWQSVNGAGTGLIQWDLFYVPLEASASIASAA